MKDKGRKIGVFSKSLRGIFFVIALLLVLIVVAYFVLYKSGEASLKKQEHSNAPAIKSDRQQIEEIKNNLTNPIAWKDGWVAYDGKVYEYDENALNFVIIGVDHGGSTVLMVSHGMGTIKDNCTKAVWIEKGELRMVGDPKEVCKAYSNMNDKSA